MRGSSSRAAIPTRAVRDLNGALPLRTFETYRSAGPLVRRELDEAERLRHDPPRVRTEPGHLPFDAAAGRLVAVWNAYVLQTVGEHLLDAVGHRSFGAVRAEVAARILAFLAPADRWMSQARRAVAEPSYRLERHVHLPAEPPAWPDRTHGPYPLSEALTTALRAIHARGDATLAGQVQSPVWRGEDLLGLRGILDAAASVIEYAEAPHHDEESLSSVSTALQLRYALRALFMFGQVAAVPALLGTKDPVTIASLAAYVPSNIDAWCLTDPRQRMTWRSLPLAAAAIQRLWAEDPYPAATAHVQAQIDAALRSGAIVFATDPGGVRLGSFYRCPWPAIYEVRRPVTIGGTRLTPMQHFTFDLLGEAYGRGEPYARRILVSVFVPANVVIDAGRGNGRGAAGGVIRRP